MLNLSISDNSSPVCFVVVFFLEPCGHGLTSSSFNLFLYRKEICHSNKTECLVMELIDITCVHRGLITVASAGSRT